MKEINKLEQRILDNLTHSEYNEIDDVVFPDMGFLLEGAYHEGFLSTAWKEEWEDYCKENPPGTDDFSYCDVMIRIYEKFKTKENNG